MNKQIFDPSKKSHREAVKTFMEMNTWGKTGCPFISEDRSVSVVTEITSKLVRHFLKVQNQESII